MRSSRYPRPESDETTTFSDKRRGDEFFLALIWSAIAGLYIFLKWPQTTAAGLVGLATIALLGAVVSAAAIWSRFDKSPQLAEGFATSKKFTAIMFGGFPGGLVFGLIGWKITGNVQICWWSFSIGAWFYVACVIYLGWFAPRAEAADQSV